MGAYVAHKESWPDAQSICRALGGFLAEVHSSQQNDFIKALMANHSSDAIWLGADDLVVHGQYYWATSGTPVTAFSDWDVGEPEMTDEHCIELDVKKHGGKWNNDQCDHKQHFVCQRYQTTAVVG